MKTLKLAVFVMIGFSMVSFQIGDINKACAQPASFGAVNSAVSGQMFSRDFTPIQKDASTLDSRQLMPAKHASTVRPGINTDKTYEQCMREAFERIYEEVNRMLDEVVDGREEQF